MLRRTSLALAAATLASAAGGSLVHAGPRRAVRCPAAETYAGPPLHAPPAPVGLDADGPIEGPFAAERVSRLDQAFATAAEATRAHALTAAVALPGEGMWTADRGQGHGLHYWASAGKQATALVVLQLADEGRLRLADPVSLWVKGVPNGEVITIEQLLSHTSGLFSANEDPQVRARGGRLTWEEELAVLRRQGPLFCPGLFWRYSNSGYSVLGKVIEAADGRPWARAIEARIVAPLKLKDTRVLEPGASIADIAPPRSDTAEPPVDMTVPGPAGPLAASAADMVRLQQALIAGRLVRLQTVARMFARLYPMFDATTFYGLGAMLYDSPDAGLYWLGHSGGAPGVKAVVAYAPRQRAFVAVALTGDGNAHAAARLLVKAAVD